MPNREIRAGIKDSEAVDLLTAAAEVFFYRLMLTVDDYARFYANPAILRAYLYPLKIDRIKEAYVNASLHLCVKAGLIDLYKVDGKSYLQIRNFKQRMRAAVSKFPAPDGQMLLTDSKNPSFEQGQALNDGQTPDKKRAEAGHDAGPPPSESESESESNKPPPAARPANPLFDALAEACGSNVAEMTKPAAKACGVALADIRRVSPGVTESDIRQRCATYKRLHWDWPLTPSAVSKHWGELGGGPAARQAVPAVPKAAIPEPAGWRERYDDIVAADPVFANYVAKDDPWEQMDRGNQRHIAEFMERRVRPSPDLARPLNP